MKSLSTQDFLEFEEIREGIIILKNKGFRMVLMVSSLNFALKSDEEQSAIIYQFQNFLNSLDFSCQIIVQSRKLNIVGYLEKLKEIEKRERDELLKIQIREYIKFIGKIMQRGTIMQKTFYVVVPFSLGEAESGKMPKISTISEERFKRCRNQLLQRSEFVILGLRACGLKAAPLNSLELSEFLWGLFHPSEAEKGYYPEIPPELIK